MRGLPVYLCAREASGCKADRGKTCCIGEPVLREHVEPTGALLFISDKKPAGRFLISDQLSSTQALLVERMEHQQDFGGRIFYQNIKAQLVQFKNCSSLF